MQAFTYDIWDTIEVPTFVLSNIWHHHIGVITNIDKDSINYNFNMSSSQEVSFDVYKELDGNVCNLWDKIISFKYVYIPEHQCYYHMEVDKDEDASTVKHCTLTSAGEWELSNKKIYDLEINTESDILQDDYVTTVFFDENNPRGSLLNRVLKDKAPDWSIAHVDGTLKNIQRMFSVSDQTIYDFLTKDVATEFDCLFTFDSVNRTISAYDLLNYCNNCGYRGEFLTKCSKCNSTNISRGYGENSNILINYNNYSEKMSVTGDEGQVKNCFRVTGGDDIMNAAVINCNPNGSAYIYNFSQRDYDDMPSQLVQKLEEYGDLYDALLPDYQAAVDEYYDLTNQYYFYKTSMMPRVNGDHWEANKGYGVGDQTYVMTLPSWCYLECTQSGISGNKEFDATRVTEGETFTDGTVVWTARKHIVSVPSAQQSVNAIQEYLSSEDIYFLQNIPSALTTVNTTVKNIMALAINSLYTIEIISDSSNYVSGNTWHGRVKVYESGNPDNSYTSDTALTATLVATSVTEDYENYMKQKVEKRLDKKDTTFTEIYKIEDDDDFATALEQYSLDCLESFYKSYQGCLDILIQNNVTNENSEFYGVKLYDSIYKPYYDRMQMISEEMTEREATVNDVKSRQETALETMRGFQDQLDMQNYLGDDLYLILHAYIRESSYNNSNYISEGLSDGEVLADANTLLEIANRELEKATELQYTLSDTMKNLLNTIEFRDYKDKFKLGDYIICEVDDELFQLRLISCSYGFGNPENISVTFSNVTRVQNYFADAQDVLSKAKTMSTTYNAVTHQVEKNTDTTSTVNSWESDGLNTATTALKNNDYDEIVYNSNGLLARQYDEDLGEYGSEQIKISHNFIAFTDDGWLTTSMGIGKQEYTYYDKDQGAFVDRVGFGISAEFMKSGFIYGSQIVAGEIISDNYSPTANTGAYIDLANGYLSFAGGALTYGEDGLKIGTPESGGTPPTITGAVITDSPINVNNNFIVDSDGNCNLADTMSERFLECF